MLIIFIKLITDYFKLRFSDDITILYIDKFVYLYIIIMSKA